MMAYPNRRTASSRGVIPRAHVYNLLTRYLESTCRRGRAAASCHDHPASAAFFHEAVHAPGDSFIRRAGAALRWLPAPAAGAGCAARVLFVGNSYTYFNNLAARSVIRHGPVGTSAAASCDGSVRSHRSRAARL